MHRHPLASLPVLPDHHGLRGGVFPERHVSGMGRVLFYGCNILCGVELSHRAAIGSVIGVTFA